MAIPRQDIKSRIHDIPLTRTTHRSHLKEAPPAPPIETRPPPMVIQDTPTKPHLTEPERQIMHNTVHAETNATSPKQSVYKFPNNGIQAMHHRRLSYRRANPSGASSTSGRVQLTRSPSMKNPQNIFQVRAELERSKTGIIKRKTPKDDFLTNFFANRDIVSITAS